MALRTYLPFLRVLARAVCSYINKYHDKLAENVGAPGVGRLDAANEACNILVALLDTLIPEPS